MSEEESGTSAAPSFDVNFNVYVDIDFFVQGVKLAGWLDAFLKGSIFA